jgi:hypothetical protein
VKEPKQAIRRLIGFTCLAALILHLYPVCRPVILFDDFAMLARSLTWRAAWRNLWVPSNEHAMPLGRLSTALLLQIAGRQTNYPLVTAIQGPLALLAGMGLLYLFVRRELGHPWYALVAVILFGVTSIYQQAVGWFSASFSILTMDTFLLALLAVQAWRQERKAVYLALCAAACGLALGWFASGILAGPLCSAYLLGEVAHKQNATDTARVRRFAPWFASAAAALAPVLGTAAFLAISLPRTANAIMYTEHYEGETALQAFHPLVGLMNTGRSLVDNLALGAIGISGLTCPLAVVPVVLLGFIGVVVWWWRPVKNRRLLVLGTALIVMSYWLVYSARAEWGYDGMMMLPNWGRYHLLPQLGLALLVVGGLPRYKSPLEPDGALSPLQLRLLYFMIATLFVIQLPRAIFATPLADTAQYAVLRQIEETDTRCREHHISADTAREALSRLRVPECNDSDNGWDLLRGSDDPWPWSVEEVRRLIKSP